MSVFRPTGSEAITVTNSACTGLSTSKYLITNGTKVSDYATVVCETAQVRYSLEDSTVPTSAGVGTPIDATQSFVLDSYEALRDFSVICTNASLSASLKVNYFKEYK